MAVLASPFGRTRVVFAATALLVTLCLFLSLSYREALPGDLREHLIIFSHAQNTTPQKPVSSHREPCEGPRGKLIDENSDDQVQAITLDTAFPVPVGGSYHTLGLPQTWNTPSTRYGAYGLGEDEPDYNRTRVQWNTVDWAALQNSCLVRNQNRFRNPTSISTTTRFRLRDDKWSGYEPLSARPYSTGRTAIVLRGWEGYNYTPADLYHIRSLIVEAGLSANADYAVFLLVDVKDRDGSRRIFHSSESYTKALEELVPDELRSIAVLFDDELLRSWYPNIPEHSAFWQVYQPLQLFAQIFTGFDHFWQFELDSKITGDSRVFLDALSNFARKEPRKQSVERSSYYYMPSVHGSYDDMRASINASLNGGGIWGPVNIPDIPHPIGPTPPVERAEEDDFEWGVGDEADLILTNAFANVKTTAYWPFKGWVHGFQDGEETPRFYSPVAMGRYSWDLLNAIHHAQAHQGLTLPSEATPTSFALYHGLKVVFPPHPWYHHPQRDVVVSDQELENLFNGGTPAQNAETNGGLSFGKALYNPDGVYELFNGGTWWWVPGYPGRIMKKWMTQNRDDIQPMLREVEGKIYAPMMAMHPVKTGDNA